MCDPNKHLRRFTKHRQLSDTYGGCGSSVPYGRCGPYTHKVYDCSDTAGYGYCYSGYGLPYCPQPYWNGGARGAFATDSFGYGDPGGWPAEFNESDHVLGDGLHSGGGTVDSGSAFETCPDGTISVLACEECSKTSGNVGNPSDVAAGIGPMPLRSYGPADTCSLESDTLQDTSSCANQDVVPPANPWPPTAPPGLAWVPLPDNSESLSPGNCAQHDAADLEVASLVSEGKYFASAFNDPSFKDMLDPLVSSYLYDENQAGELHDIS